MKPSVWTGVAPRACACVLALVVSAAVLTGCWDRVEMDEVGIVGSIAFDKGEGGRTIVSLEVLNAATLARGMGPGTDAGSVVAWVLRDEAATTTAAIANAQRRAPRFLSLGQVNTAIWGQELARDGIGEQIDYLGRHALVRRSIFVATCDTGSGLLQRPFIESLPSRTLSGLATTAERSGKSTMVTLNEFILKLAEPGIEPITMHTAGRRTDDVQVKRQGEKVEQTHPAAVLEEPLDVSREAPGDLPAESPVLEPLAEAGTGEPPKAVTIDLGIGVFKGDRLVGFLDGTEARGYLWAMGRIDEAALEIPSPDGEKIVGLTVVRTRSKTQVIPGEILSVKVDVQVDLEVAQTPVGVGLEESGLVDAMEASVNELIEKEVRDALAMVQKEFRSDIYGFGNRLWKTRPDLFRPLEPTWNEEVFPRLEVQVEAKSRIRSPGSFFELRAR